MPLRTRLVRVQTVVSTFLPGGVSRSSVTFDMSSRSSVTFDMSSRSNGTFDMPSNGVACSPVSFIFHVGRLSQFRLLTTSKTRKKQAIKCDMDASRVKQ
ncbi:hypothetical protein FWK35_00021086, partial [Aphis craccivora]